MIWYQRYAAAMFTYGFYRGMRSTYHPVLLHHHRDMPMGTRILHSLINGVIYVTPYGAVSYTHLTLPTNREV